MDGLIRVPRVTVGDDRARLLEWTVAEGGQVAAGDVVAVVETSKAAFEIETACAGFVHQLARAGADVEVGVPIARVTDQPAPAACEPPPAAGPVFTEKAKARLAREGLSAERFAHLKVVRESDIEAALGAPPPDLDATLRDPRYRELLDLLSALRARMRGRFDRHVPTGDLLSDRWQLARDHGFGEGTSVYDECLVLGRPTVGRHCWIGPYTVLDAAHAALVIGDYSSVGSGAQIYTHNTLQRTLTGGTAAPFARATTIGRCCFVSPLAVLGAGVTLGDHSFVAAGSFVEGEHPPYSWLGGNPAQRLGHVEIVHGHARLVPA